MQELVQELHTLTSTTSEQSKQSCHKIEDNSTLKIEEEVFFLYHFTIYRKTQTDSY